MSSNQQAPGKTTAQPEQSEVKMSLSISRLAGATRVWPWISLVLFLSLLGTGYFAYERLNKANQLTETYTELENGRWVLQERIDTLQSQNNELQLSLAQVQLDYDALQAQLRDSARSQQTLQEQIYTLEKDKADLGVIAENLEVQNQRFQTSVTLLEEENAQLETELLAVAPHQETLQLQVDQLETENAAMSIQLASLQSDMITLSADYEQLQAMLGLENERLSLISNATRIVTIPGTDLAPEASATFYIDLSGEIGLVLLRGVNNPTLDETYQLWLIPASREPILAGPVTVTNQQADWTVVDIPASAQKFDFIGISRENADWLPTDGPTSDSIVLLGSIN